MKNKLILALKIIFAGVLLFIFFRKTDLSAVFSALRSMPPALIFTVALIDVASLTLAAFKWKLLLPSYPFGRIFRVSLVGRFYSFVLPGQIVGESMKAYHLGSAGKNVEETGASVFVDKLTGVTGIFLAAAAGIFLTKRELPPLFFPLFVSAAAILLIFLFSFGAAPVRGLIAKMGLHASAGKLSAYAADKKLVSAQLLFGLGYQLAGVWILWLFGRVLGTGLAFGDFCWIGGAVSLALLLPVTIGGLGVREGAFVGILGWLGIGKEKALALSLAFFCVQIFDAALGAVFFLAEMRGRRKKESR